jgi:hypothetical protein
LGRELTVCHLFRPQEKVSDHVRTNCRLFCESLRWLIQSQIILASIERPSRTSSGALSRVNALDSTNCPRPPPHNAVFVRCEAALMCSRERRLPTRRGSGRGASAIGARPDATTRCGQGELCGIDRGQTKPHRPIDSRTPNDELAASRRRTSSEDRR